MKNPRTVVFSLVAGAVLGAAAYHGAMVLAGRTTVSQAYLDGLLQENAELTDELFAPRTQGGIVFSSDNMPYDENADAAALIGDARELARQEGKFLMVTFGANWCLDCRTLYHHLRSPEVRIFTADTFDFVNVNVGKFNTNVDLANDLGVDLRRGIPVAVFFGPDGQVIGTTNEGQLEPARFYTSKQILKFIRDIVEKSLITAPDSVH